MDKEELRKFVNKILAKKGFPPVKKFASEFADGIIFQTVFNIMFDETIDCKLVPSALVEDRILNWSRINQMICFNYLQQRFYLVEPTMKSLAKGVSSDSIFKLLKVMISTQQQIYMEATKDTTAIDDICDNIETDRYLFSEQGEADTKKVQTLQADENGEWGVPAYIEDQISSQVPPKPEEERKYDCQTYTGERSSQFDYLLGQKLDLTDRQGQSPDLKQKRDDYNQYIADLNGTSQESQVQQQEVMTKVDQEIKKTFKTPTKKKNPNTSKLAATQSHELMNDTKVSKKDIQMLKGLNTEERESLKDKVSSDRRILENLKNQLRDEFSRNEIDLDNLQRITKSEITSLKTMNKPSALIQETLFHVFLQLGYDQATCSDWKFIKSEISNTTRFMGEILGYDGGDFAPKTYAKVIAFLQENSAESISNNCKSLSGIYIWLKTVNEFQSIGIDIRKELLKVQKRLNQNIPLVGKLATM